MITPRKYTPLTCCIITGGELFGRIPRWDECAGGGRLGCREKWKNRRKKTTERKANDVERLRRRRVKGRDRGVVR